ncbi:hypothetical protein [Fictibacillus terranigra]|uniref:Uncharacterized protein n=1 Tax=Fictibacillus terranigra TaxID=3058424 RepID=A0ABT8E8U7_9BACL|nr:hypothetical protein [Fictibacillus sp. CENA-BCM004]MDN4074300.1 hypothetical protein [Fictibacillus sp. CENA-BCM004]
MSTIAALLEKIALLEKQLQEIQKRCPHVFLETSHSDERICMRCSYTEKIVYRFPEEKGRGARHSNKRTSLGQ